MTPVASFILGALAALTLAMAGLFWVPVQTGSSAAIEPAPLGVLQGPPSLSAAQVDRVLQEYGSPAQGSGQDFYNLSLQYNIDDAYALAFFVQESSAGTDPRWDGIKADGTTTHDIGNIACAGYPTCYGRWRDYSSWREGIEDWYRLIRDEYIEARGHTTIDEVLPIYAPAFENDTAGYTNSVSALVAKWREETRGASLPPVSLPTGDSMRQALVAYALRLQGIPYVRGGRSASGGDCSGTMQHIYLTVAGIDIGSTTFSQYPQLQPVDEAELQPGDLWYGQYADDQHVGMVADVNGDGRWDLINNGGLASNMHTDLDFLSIDYFAAHTMGFRRAL